jgi:hypothetical protein
MVLMRSEHFLARMPGLAIFRVELEVWAGEPKLVAPYDFPVLMAFLKR